MINIQTSEQIASFLIDEQSKETENQKWIELESLKETLGYAVLDSADIILKHLIEKLDAQEVKKNG